MKFSALARTYDRVAAAPREPERAKLLAQVCKRADRPTLYAVAHFTLGDLAAVQARTPGLVAILTATEE